MENLTKEEIITLADELESKIEEYENWHDVDDKSLEKLRVILKKIKQFSFIHK